MAPTVVSLRAKTKGVVQAELDRSLSGRLKHLTEGDRAALQQMMDSAVNKLLHAPTTRLKVAASGEDGADLVRAVVHLFDLPEAPPPEPEKREREAPQASAAAQPDDDDRLH